MTSTDISQRSTFTDETLAAIQSFEDAMRLARDNGIPSESMADYGTGFKVVDKESLVGTDFLILEWRFNEGDYEGDFVSVTAVTKHNEKVIFNDGSTGVCAQLNMVTAQRKEKKHPTPQAFLGVPGGLTVSQYWRNTETGEISRKPQGKGWEPAKTYYLAS